MVVAPLGPTAAARAGEETVGRQRKKESGLDAGERNPEEEL